MLLQKDLQLFCDNVRVGVARAIRRALAIRRPSSGPLLCEVAGRPVAFLTCSDQLGVTLREVEEFVSRAGRPAGPPWTQEHRRAYAAGIAVLAAHAHRRLKIARP